MPAVDEVFTEQDLVRCQVIACNNMELFGLAGVKRNILKYAMKK